MGRKPILCHPRLTSRVAERQRHDDCMEGITLTLLDLSSDSALQPLTRPIGPSHLRKLRQG